MLSRWRPLYEKLSLPLGKSLAHLGFNANTVSFLSLATAVLAGITLALRQIGWGVALTFLMIMLDALDGSIARAHGQLLPFGRILDHCLDRIGEIVILGGILLGGLSESAYVYGAISGILMSSYVRAKAESVGIAECAVGVAGRLEKILILLLGLSFEILFWGKGLLKWFLLMIAVVSYITTIQRLIYSYRVTAISAIKDGRNQGVMQR